ncbi:hypothetical protein [Polaribacter butkevichii]|uniref:DUF998 domain-containing protein n=1 Tax=Polaribacter butkevichii TaxID=218490 RepID=A0A2P6CBU1_9FLAO|nr:hypothetical protein [Polaribacter butkevichii]PQJ72377.1 hypothetical protein BTO14_03530 [Polaribacter butkevichii]
MKNEHQTENDLIISYKLLRKLIGSIGVFLPVILGFGMLYFDKADFIKDSISDYYGTQLRDVFVGFLFVLGFFLFSYKGYKSEGKGLLYNDNFFANLGGAFAICVALFPTTSKIAFIRTIHLSSAVLLFAVFTYFCLVIFRRGVAIEKRSEMKKLRNKFYLGCGILIILFVGSAGLSFIVMTEEARNETNIIFYCETLALWAFGFSWLIKGEAVLEDTSKKQN